MTKDDALTLEALKYAASKGYGRIVREMKIAPFTIKEALAQPAQPAQEPVNIRAKFLAENIVEAIDCLDFAGAKATLEMLTTLAQPAQEPPSEWAGIKAILDEYGLQAIDFVADWKAAQEPVAWAVQAVEEGLQAAIATEREACAKVCDEVGEHPSLTPRHCAEGIRARGNT